MKRIAALLLVAVLAVGMTACGNSKGGSQGAQGGDATSASAESAQGDNGASASLEEKDFADWNDQDILEYFKSVGVFENEDYLYVMNTPDELIEGMTAIVNYQEPEMFDADVMILYLDENSPSAATEEMYQHIKDKKSVQLSDDENDIIPFNALIGRFAILYRFSLDDDFLAKYEAALDKLIETKNITPEFYDKEIDLSEFGLSEEDIM